MPVRAITFANQSPAGAIQIRNRQQKIKITDSAQRHIRIHQFRQVQTLEHDHRDGFLLQNLQHLPQLVVQKHIAGRVLQPRLVHLLPHGRGNGGRRRVEALHLPVQQRQDAVQTSLMQDSLPVSGGIGG